MGRSKRKQRTARDFEFNRLKIDELQKQAELGLADAAQERAIDRVLADIAPDVAEEKAVADAKAFLYDRLDNFNRFDLPEALADRFENLESLPNSDDWPEAYHGKFGSASGPTLRIGTEYQNNDITGTRIPIPSADPTDAGKPLTMYEGTRRDAQRIQQSGQKVADDMLSVPKASEYIQRQILRRMGWQAEMLNDEGDPLTTDMRINNAPEGKKMVDGQVSKIGKPIKNQLYTWIEPTNPTGFDVDDDARDVKRALDKMIDDSPKDGIRNPVIRDSYAVNPKLRGPAPGVAPFEGKIFHDKQSVEPNKVKDWVLHTGYEPSFASQNNRARDTIAQAPKDLNMDSTAAMRQVIDRTDPETLKSQVVVHRNAQLNNNKLRPQANYVADDATARAFRMPGKRLLESYPQVAQFLDKSSELLKNPVVRGTGVALGAIPVLGDAADATTGTYDAVTKKGDQQVRGAGNAVAGITGLASVAAPAAAPVLAPVSIGLGGGNALADWTKERRAKDKKYTRNTGSVDPFIHSVDAPVTIQAPSAQPIVSETQRRRNARRSTPGTVKSKPGGNAGAWWNRALGALGLQ